MKRTQNPLRSRIQIRNREKRCGAALVEMALVLPVFITVVLGIVEFGRGMMVAQSVTSAAREGARVGVLGGKSNADVESFVKEFMAGAAGVSQDDINVTITVTAAPGNTTSTNEVSAAQTRDKVKVEVSVLFDKVSFIPGDYLAGKSLVGNSTMLRE